MVFTSEIVISQCLYTLKSGIKIVEKYQVLQLEGDDTVLELSFQMCLRVQLPQLERVQQLVLQGTSHTL